MTAWLNHSSWLKIKPGKVIGFLLLIFAGLLFSHIASAALPSLVNIPATDVSRYNIMDYLFGPLDGQPGYNPFQSIMAVLLTAVLSLGGVLVAYTILQGTVDSAHDGQILGKKWSIASVPLRMALGTALMIPAPGLGGYCLAQMLVMWLALQGVGFADQAWTAYLSQALTSGAPLTVDPTPKVANLARGLLSIAGCMDAQNNAIDEDVTQDHYGIDILNSKKVSPLSAIASHIRPVGGTPGVVSLVGPGIATARYGDNQVFWFDAGNALVGPLQSACGSISVPLPTTPPATDPGVDGITDQVTYALITANDKAFSALLNKLAPVAKAAESGDQSVQVSSAITTYVSSMTSAENNIFLKQKQPIADIVKKQGAFGWIVAGALYMPIERFLSSVTTASGSVASATPMNIPKSDLGKDGSVSCGFWNSVNPFHTDCDSFAKAQKTVLTIERNTANVAAFQNQTKAVASDSDSDRAASGFMDSMLDWVFPANSPVATFFSNYMQGETMDSSNSGPAATAVTKAAQDPIIFAQNLGEYMIGLGSVVTSAMLVLTAAIGFFAPGLAFNMTMIEGFINTPLIAEGAAMAFILPMIPYLIWMAAALGWIIMLLESMIGVVLLCLLYVHPDGDGIVGRAGQGMMMILGLTLKPLLMIFGLVFALTLLKPIGFLVNFTFGYAVSGVLHDAGGFFKLIAFLGMFAVYASLLIGLTKKVFELIYVVPDTVMKWIGAPGATQLGNTAQAASGIAQSAKGASSATYDGAQKLGSKAALGFAAGRKAQHDHKKEMGHAGEAHERNLLDKGMEADRAGASADRASASASTAESKMDSAKKNMAAAKGYREHALGSTSFVTNSRGNTGNNGETSAFGGNYYKDDKAAKKSENPFAATNTNNEKWNQKALSHFNNKNRNMGAAMSGLSTSDKDLLKAAIKDEQSHADQGIATHMGSSNAMNQSAADFQSAMACSDTLAGKFQEPLAAGTAEDSYKDMASKITTAQKSLDPSDLGVVLNKYLGGSTPEARDALLSSVHNYQQGENLGNQSDEELKMFKATFPKGLSPEMEKNSSPEVKAAVRLSQTSRPSIGASLNVLRRDFSGSGNLF